MIEVGTLLGELEPRHRSALRWFMDHAGTETPWPRPLADGTLLASKAKGIYKPSWTPYALSVRQTMGGPYPDRDPVARPDGTWAYAYYQEGDDPAARDAEFTNLGLVACWRDQVPVGVMRQASRRPSVRYNVLGVALVAGWEGGYFFLEGFSPAGSGRAPGSGAEVDVLAAEARRLVDLGSFNPQSIIDARQRAIASIVRRQGQPAFRAQLLDLYEGRCAITGCGVVDVLEAAHIVPYRGAATNDLRNGLLLRADIHSLFDLGLISVDPVDRRVVVSSALEASDYAALGGQQIRPPRLSDLSPSEEALSAHLSWSLSRHTGGQSS